MTDENFNLLSVWVNWLGNKSLNKPLTMWESRHFVWYATRGHFWTGYAVSFDLPSGASHD